MLFRDAPRSAAAPPSSYVAQLLDLSKSDPVAAVPMSAVTHNGIAAAAWWTALRGYLLMGVALTVVFFAASGFVLNTISSGVEVRGDRITPAVELARRTADTLTKSRQAECATRGSRCRDLEAPPTTRLRPRLFF